MILTLIIPTLVAAAVVSAATIKKPGKGLMFVGLFLATYLLQSIDLMFAELQDASMERTLMIHVLFAIPYIAILFAYQQLYLIKTEDATPTWVASAAALLVFTFLSYMIEEMPSKKLYQFGQFLWTVEFFVILLLSQRLWTYANFLKKPFGMRSRVTQLFKTMTLLVLLSFLAPVLLSLLHMENNVSYIISPRATLILLKILILGLLITRIYRLRKAYYTKEFPGLTPNNVQDLAW